MTEAGGKQITKASANLSYVWLFMAALMAFGLTASRLNGKELKPETVAGWDDYVRVASSGIETEAKAPHFLQVFGMPERLREVQAGEIAVWRANQRKSQHVSDGLIHDWFGAVFIPKVTMADVLAVARDYEQYPEVYKPAVIEANTMTSHQNNDRFSMLLTQKVLFVTAALQGEYETQYVRVNENRWYSISRSTRLQAIERYGRQDMALLPPDSGPGYLWRLYSVTKFEECDGGVYVEVEALGLSRDVPAMLKWLVDPVVEHLPRNSMRATLEATRGAVVARMDARIGEGADSAMMLSGRATRP
jgi:hypothetical protein